MRPAATLALLASALAVSTPAGGQESAYTELDLRACEVLRRFEESGGSELRCEGLEGLDVLVSEGDLRFDVDFGASDDSFDTFGPFNWPGTRVEWRLADGAPFAAILRFGIEPVDGVGEKGSVLGVYKVGEEGAPGCPVAYVDALANPKANLMARQVADAFVRAFRCGEDRATYVGVVGPLSGGAYATYAPD